MLLCLIITKLIICYNYWINTLLISFLLFCRAAPEQWNARWECCLDFQQKIRVPFSLHADQFSCFVIYNQYSTFCITSYYVASLFLQQQFSNFLEGETIWQWENVPLPLPSSIRKVSLIRPPCGAGRTTRLLQTTGTETWAGTSAEPCTYTRSFKCISGTK